MKTMSQLENIEAIEKAEVCFTHFRWGVGRKIFEKGDLFT